MLDAFEQSYHWSLMQVEYATDLVFRSTTTLAPLYEQLVRQSVLSVKAEQVATFLGRRITPQLAQEIGSQFSTRIEGTCIKHRFGNRLDQDVRQAGSHSTFWHLARIRGPRQGKHGGEPSTVAALSGRGVISRS